MSSDANSTVLGIVALVRHGDREGFYQDQSTYAASATTITPLGSQQHIQLGSLLRGLYLNQSSASHIQGMSSSALFDPTQVTIRADAGDEGGVIYDSAVSLTQGMWPATTAYNTTLANGTTIVGPLSGYQYVPIQSVESANDVSLEGFTSCGTFTTSVDEFYNSSVFTQKAQESQAFLSQLPPYLDGRPPVLLYSGILACRISLQIFDYMNVQSIHNATFADRLPATFLAQARGLADWHQYNSFSSPELDGIGNIAARTVLPSMFTGFQEVANSSQSVKIMIQAISYKPFLSLFNMTGVAEANPSLAGIAAVVFEVRQSSSGGEPVLRFNFKNGTADDFHTYNILGANGDIPLATFMSAMAPTAVNTTAQWCVTCGNTQDRGCGALSLAAAQAKTHQKISPVGAGFLGAGLTIAVMLMAFGTLAFLGVLTFGKRSKRTAIHEKKQQGSVA
ncbi:hypothetical protein EW146_g42 [Bondarzewia mesenterica]|uniref:Phosphoglycerate mutase-like protein n=1 Tax=Bondarzewia mesenterica TaxID=1095465 RepID=A0A4S4M8K4_9AGAM|nr:hypothetical protein EW146_g42 [Bondarzewia mesenterica]